MAATKVLMAFALATLTAVTIAGTTITWYDGPISERQGFIESQISGLAGEATIGQTGDSQEAEEEFRALVTFNMLAASQCELIELIHYDQNEFEDMVAGEVDDFDASGIPERNYNIDSLAERGEAAEAFYAWFDGFDALERTDFHAECYALDIDFDPTEAAAEAAEDIPGIGVGVTAARVVSDGASSVASFLGAGSDNPPFHDRDLSMEGNVGSVDFDTESNITIDDPRLLGMRLDGAESGSPRLWRGHRAALFMPGRINEGEFVTAHGVGDGAAVPNTHYHGGHQQHSNEDHRTDMDFDGWEDGLINIDRLEGSSATDTSQEPSQIAGNINFRWDGGKYSLEREGLDRSNRFFWMERVGMKNIPIVSAVNFNVDNQGGEYHSSAVLDYFMANSKYVICEGVSGTIQSNAGDPENTGDTDSDDSPVWRDVVFTTVEADLEITDCIEENTPIYRNTGDVHGDRTYRHTEDFPILDPDEGLGSNTCNSDRIEVLQDGGIDTRDDPRQLYLSSDETVEMDCRLAERRGMQHFDQSLHETDGSWGEDVTFYNLEYVFTEGVPEPQTYDVTDMFTVDDSDHGEGSISYIEDGHQHDPNQISTTIDGRITHDLTRFDRDKTVELTLDSFGGSDGQIGYLRFGSNSADEEEEIVLSLTHSENRINDHNEVMSGGSSNFNTDNELTIEARWEGDSIALYRTQEIGEDDRAETTAIGSIDAAEQGFEDGIDFVVMRADDTNYELKSLEVHNAVPRTG